MKKITVVLISLIMILSACAGPGGTQGTDSAVGAGAAGTGAEAADAEEPAGENAEDSASETGGDSAAATAGDSAGATAGDSAGDKKPELVIMGEESSDYSRAAKSKNLEVDSTTSALYAASELPKLSDKDYTVMVYVVGSNLESRYGAATNDMNEMIGAGLDFGKNNLLVYTGGSKRWTSDISNSFNSVINMENGEELEVLAQTSETADMGAAQTLSEFINYCTTNFPARHYGLILWDHGAGPLWGYGSDELFDNDSLLFEELRGAMDQTTFSGGKKLDWVGFDACLMGSVESAKLWKDYAQYLIGSEELESGRGWDYSFLSTLNETDDARTIVSAIVDAYGSYYEENKTEFFNPDVTLAAMDLSQTDAVIESTNALFTAMKKGIEEGKYAELNKARSHTKAFGLSAASSKDDAYDMLDLRDLAENVSDLYPEESKGVSEALDQMLVGYTSNVTGANGVSIYLPGDNLDLYNVSGELYSQESALSAEYTDFVSSYMDSWIEGSNTDWTLPEIERGGDELTLQLTQEQVKNSSKACYTILQRNSFGDYAITTANVTVEPDENNILHIPANPMLLTVATDMEEAPAPLTCVQAELNGDESIYKTVSCLLTSGHEFMDADWTKDEEVVIMARNSAGTREATILDITSASASAWAGGKASVDVSNYESIINAGSISYSPQRDSEGNMMPFTEWNYTGYEMYPLCLEQGFRIEMKPASEFDKDFICQVTIKDVNGNVHGSDYVDLDLDHGRNYETIATEKGTLYADVSGEEAVIVGYEGEDEEITVPAEISGKKVTEIGNEAFSGDSTCVKITLPDSIKTIGISAFRRSGITQMEIPAGVEVIKRGAFSHTALTSVKLPDGLSFIGSIPFADCKSLSEIAISESNPNYKTVDGVLYSKDGKTLIQYPAAKGGEYKVEDGTEVVGYGSFASAAATKVIFPESLRSIENMAFFEAQALTSFNLPDSVETIGAHAFGDFGFHFGDEEKPLIETLHMGPNVRFIGADAFTMMNIGAFEVDEGNQYFASSGGFITGKSKDMILEVPRGMKPVMVIPDGISTLQDYLLEECNDVKDIVIPDSVFRFGTRVFPYDLGEEDETGKAAHVISCRFHCTEGSAAESYAKQYEIAYDDIMEPERLVHEEQTQEVPAAEGAPAVTLTWNVFKDRAELAGYSMEERGPLIIPSTYNDLPVTAIRREDTGYAYYNNCTKVEIPASVSAIDTLFFDSSDYNTEYAVDENNEYYKSLDGVLFDAEGDVLLLYPQNRQGAEYEVPSKTETIGKRAFRSNNLLTKVTLPKSLRTIEEYAFSSCNALTTVEFTKGLKEIKEWAFNYTDLVDVKLPSSVVRIGDAAFTVGEGFGRIEFPEKLEYMGYHAFTADYGLTVTQDVIRIPEKLVIINQPLGDILFEKYEVDEASENYQAVDGLLMSKDGRTLVSVPTLWEGDLVVPEGTYYIEYNAVRDCAGVTDIYLPDTVIDIGGIGEKNYETGEYRFVIHCNEGTEAQKSLDARGIPWVAR